MAEYWHTEILVQNWIQLQDRINARDQLLNRLLQKQVITPRQKERYKSCKTNYELVEELLQDLMKMPAKCYEDFRQCLINDNQKHVVSKYLPLSGASGVCNSIENHSSTGERQHQAGILQRIRTGIMNKFFHVVPPSAPQNLTIEMVTIAKKSTESADKRQVDTTDDSEELEEVKTVNVFWDKPADDGGSPIEGYIIKRKLGRDNKWREIEKVEVTPYSETSFQDPELNMDQGVFYSVAAWNNAGRGTYMETTYVPPFPPRHLNVTPSISGPSIFISWKEPEQNGGSKILKYIIERKVGKTGDWQQIQLVPAYKMEFKGLRLEREEGEFYRICAMNLAGRGPFTETTYEPPSAPLKVIQSQNSTITWQTPKQNGGSPITGYVVEEYKPYYTSWKCIEKVKKDVREVSINNSEGTHYRVAAVSLGGKSPYGYVNTNKLNGSGCDLM